MRKLLTICVLVTTICLFSIPAHAIAIWGTGKVQLFDDNGAVLAGGKVYTYEPGSGVSKQTYSEYSGQTANTNPVILDSAGRATIYLDGSYKIVVHDSDDTLVWSLDNVAGEGFNVVTNVSTGVSGTFVLFGPSGTSTFNYLDKISGVSIVDELTLSSVTANVIRSGTSRVIDGHTSGNTISVEKYNSTVVHFIDSSTIYGLPIITGNTQPWTFKFLEGAEGGGITIFPSNSQYFLGNAISGSSHLSLPPGNPGDIATIYSVSASGTCKFWFVDHSAAWVAGN